MRNEVESLLLQLQFSSELDILTSEMMQDKEEKDIQIVKEKMKWFLFTDGMSTS